MFFSDGRGFGAGTMSATRRVTWLANQGSLGYPGQPGDSNQVWPVSTPRRCDGWELGNLTVTRQWAGHCFAWYARNSGHFHIICWWNGLWGKILRIFLVDGYCVLYKLLKMLYVNDQKMTMDFVEDDDGMCGWWRYLASKLDCDDDGFLKSVTFIMIESSSEVTKSDLYVLLSLYIPQIWSTCTVATIVVMRVVAV